jgi:hypothetical protein
MSILTLDLELNFTGCLSPFPRSWLLCSLISQDQKSISSRTLQNSAQNARHLLPIQEVHPDDLVIELWSLLSNFFLCRIECGDFLRLQRVLNISIEKPSTRPPPSNSGVVDNVNAFSFLARVKPIALGE